MPGSSIWLLPPRHLEKYIQPLIASEIPSLFPGTPTYNFIPHITLTSNIDPSLYAVAPDLGEWLVAAIDDPESKWITVEFEAVEAGDPFFKKMTVRLEKDYELLRLASVVRKNGVLNGDEKAAERWAKEEYLPHLSLMYADIPKSDVTPQLEAATQALQRALASFAEQKGEPRTEGCRIVLIPTNRPISEWKPIAEIEIGGVQWMFKNFLAADVSSP